MFRQELENDLRAIFEINEIRYQSVDEGLEQDVLYLQIDTVKEMPKHDHFYFAVRGTLGTHSLQTVNKYGYLLERARLANVGNKDRFRFSSREKNIPVTFADDLFIKTKLDFEYRVKIPFNPTVGEITYPKMNWVRVVINKIFKKG